MNTLIRPIALAIGVFMAPFSSSYAQSASPSSDTQDRLGLLLNVPFDGSGFKFADAILSLAYQNADVTGNGNVSGWQVSIGSRLNKFTPIFSTSALAGSRCTYGSIGVSYGDGKWGLPVFIYASNLQLGLSNAGSFGGAQVGVSSLECFKRYVPSEVTSIDDVPEDLGA